ncbi:hypothetical protein [Candidatus Regiella endosymbiont of Tuberolachnus salignus]|uniref:hypothetical protein n=1 Tax=Candidatus Regiella endosymbiont of Tuberolachnus salignus TaxID=3077956 RepID=UPI0030CA77B8
MHKPLFSGVKVVFMRVPPLYPNKLIACFAKKTQSCAHLRGRRVNSLLLLGLLIPEFEPVALFVEKHPVLAPSPAIQSVLTVSVRFIPYWKRGFSLNAGNTKPCVKHE